VEGEKITMEKELKVLLGMSYLFDKSLKEEDFRKALMQFEKQIENRIEEKISKIIDLGIEKLDGEDISEENAMVIMILSDLKKQIKGG